MPSRFTGLAKQSLVQQSPANDTPWDVYDNVPLDPGYVSLANLAAITRRLSK